MDKKQIWIALGVVAVLILIGLAAGWAWSAGAAAAGAAAAAKAMAEARARQKALNTAKDAQKDVQEAKESIAVLVTEIDEGTLEIDREVSAMTPEEKIALAKKVLTRADP